MAAEPAGTQNRPDTIPQGVKVNSCPAVQNNDDHGTVFYENLTCWPSVQDVKTHCSRGLLSPKPKTTQEVRKQVATRYVWKTRGSMFAFRAASLLMGTPHDPNASIEQTAAIQPYAAPDVLMSLYCDHFSVKGKVRWKNQIRRFLRVFCLWLPRQLSKNRVRKGSTAEILYRPFTWKCTIISSLLWESTWLVCWQENFSYTRWPSNQQLVQLQTQPREITSSFP